MTARSLAGALAAALDGGRLVDDPAVREAAAIDGRVPRWVGTPVTLDEVARILALAHDEGLAVVPRGSGAALELGRPPERLDLVLDLTRLDRVLEHNPDDLTVTVEAGITAGALAARLAAHRQTLPVDPPGWERRTVGGLTATRAWGPLRLRYGGLRDLLLGVRFVQADGVPTWGGARVVKSVTGYDVPKLMVGSLGTLGVLGELTLRLHPMPDFEASCLVTLGSLEAAQAFVARLLDSAIQPQRLEFVNDVAATACGLERVRAALAISVATVEAAVREQLARIRQIAERAGGRVQTLGGSFWTAYDRVLAERGRLSLTVATLVTRLAATVTEVQAALAAAGEPAPLIAGSAALGALRVAGDGADSPATAAAIERLRGFVAEADGGVVVERGPRELRATLDPWGPLAPGPLALMRRLKDEFDPRRVLNPGRFVGGL